MPRQRRFTQREGKKKRAGGRPAFVVVHGVGTAIESWSVPTACGCTVYSLQSSSILECGERSICGELRQSFPGSRRLNGFIAGSKESKAQSCMLKTHPLYDALAVLAASTAISC